MTTYNKTIYLNTTSQDDQVKRFADMFNHDLTVRIVKIRVIKQQGRFNDDQNQELS